MKTVYTLLLLFFFGSVMAQSTTDFKPALKKVTDDLAQQLKSESGKKVAVANFVDLQGNVSELGRYLAQQFSVNLIRAQMNVVDRSQLDRLMEENKMSAKGLLEPQNQAKLGKMAGIDIIITGTTSPFDNTVELTVTAIDIAKGSATAASDGTIPRTDAINALLRSQVSGSGGTGNSSVNNTAYIPVAPGGGQDPSLALMGDKLFDLPKGQCMDKQYVYGQVYFENTLKVDLVLYNMNGLYHNNNAVMIAAGTKNYTPLLYTNYSGKTDVSSDYTFKFHTTEEEERQRKYGTMNVVVTGCKVKVHVINSNRLFLSKQQ